MLLEGGFVGFLVVVAKVVFGKFAGGGGGGAVWRLLVSSMRLLTLLGARSQC